MCETHSKVVGGGGVLKPHPTPPPPPPESLAISNTPDRAGLK